MKDENALANQKLSFWFEKVILFIFEYLKDDSAYLEDSGKHCCFALFAIS
ncbi:hypothetical protein QVN49_08570 [Megasphaera hexanoica]|jgi:hypothetical protein|nr:MULTISPECIES: hypothetical protein [Megasphaera]MDN0047062.1 hypothetical protein [Megasphaera hexanoica]